MRERILVQKKNLQDMRKKKKKPEEIREEIKDVFKVRATAVISKKDSTIFALVKYGNLYKEGVIYDFIPAIDNFKEDRIPISNCEGNLVMISVFLAEKPSIHFNKKLRRLTEAFEKKHEVYLANYDTDTQFSKNQDFQVMYDLYLDMDLRYEHNWIPANVKGSLLEPLFRQHFLWRTFNVEHLIDKALLEGVMKDPYVYAEVQALRERGSIVPVSGFRQ